MVFATNFGLSLEYVYIYMYKTEPSFFLVNILCNFNMSGAKPALPSFPLPQVTGRLGVLVSHIKTSHVLPLFSSLYPLAPVNSILEMSPECHALSFLPTGSQLSVPGAFHP